MSKIIPKLRVIFLVVIIVVALILSLVRLMKLQIVQGKEYLSQSVKRTIGTQKITAPRGEIVDVNGNPIVKNEAGFNIIIQKAFFPDDYQEQNDIIMKVINILKSQGAQWVDALPITKTYPLEFLSDKDSEILKSKELLRLNTYATADNCVDKLISDYKISDNYTDEEKRLIAGVRYQMLATEFSISNDYIFAQNVSDEVVAKISELSYLIDGVTIKETPVRVYVDGTVLAHSIGTIGPIYAEEYADLKEKGYGLNDNIGKSGVEKAMEDVLRGQDGIKNIAIGSDADDVEISVDKEATAGNTVRLTIDAEFQKKCQDILADTIQRLNDQPDDELAKGRDAKGGAIVVTDVKTGAVRALVSYPSYDINDYINNYAEVASGENSPLINRAIDGLYRPGSTFKPITAVTLLNEGLITPETEFNCAGAYNYFGIIMKCWSSAGHGDISVTRAIQESCNIFFYKAVQLTDIDTLVKYEKLFGLGTDSTLEIGGKTGYLACPETLDNLKIGWTAGQLLQAAIGQSEVLVTPLQMAEEAMTIANRGIRYNPYIIDSIWDYNQSKMISKTQSVVGSTINEKQDEVFDPVIQGMIGAANSTPGYYNVFPYDEYTLTTLPKQAAIKTGSPQMTKEVTSSAFIGFYPVDDPEIAFSGYIEYGDNSKYMIRKIIDAYYGYDNEDIEDSSSSDAPADTQTSNMEDNVVQDEQN